MTTDITTKPNPKFIQKTADRKPGECFALWITAEDVPRSVKSATNPVTTVAIATMPISAGERSLARTTRTISCMAWRPTCDRAVQLVPLRTVLVSVMPASRCAARSISTENNVRSRAPEGCAYCRRGSLCLGGKSQATCAGCGFPDPEQFLVSCGYNSVGRDAIPGGHANLRKGMSIPFAGNRRKGRLQQQL